MDRGSLAADEVAPDREQDGFEGGVEPEARGSFETLAFGRHAAGQPQAGVARKLLDSVLQAAGGEGGQHGGVDPKQVVGLEGVEQSSVIELEDRAQR